MNVLSQAIKEYNLKNYQSALSLFHKAADIYGERIVEMQVKKCIEKLKKTNIDIETFTTNKTTENTLDLATNLLLANMGKLDIPSSNKLELQQKWKNLVHTKSIDAEVKRIKLIPEDFPKDLDLVPLPEGVNDFKWNLERKKRLHITQPKKENIGLSIIIPTFNRGWILSITLACLCNQKTTYPFEIIVSDDGSKEDLMPIIRKYEKKLDIKYVRQKDYGYQLCAVRNLGLRTAKYDFVSILDCDMAPNPLWVNTYIEALLEDDDVALIGPRKYVDTNNIAAEQFLQNTSLIESLPEVRTNNNVAGKSQGDISVDWRLEHFKKTDNLRLCDSPFRYFSGGNVAFAKKWLEKVGWFDEEFTHWGGEDNEFGYRLFKKGCFFRAINGGMAYHQEPPGKENETDRDAGKKVTLNIVREKVPYFYRKIEPIETAHLYRIPLVSVYIPAYNCASSIQRCVNSALNQTITDLEVCICNDGSTDNTLEVIKKLYGNNPRVKILSQENGGIASASNYAVKNASGYYIAQLDSDDYLEPDAVELCLKEFLKDRQLACVYTTNRNVNPDGTLIANGYNWPEFSREKLTTAMIVHHFRMFTARAWYLTTGFDEQIENSVDLDMYLKLSEIGPFKHINKICYNRVLHGNNTSIKKLGLQKKNHFLVVNNSLARQGIKHYHYSALDNDNASRKYTFKRNEDIIYKPVQNREKKGLAFSLVYPDHTEGLFKKLSNIIEYNPETTIIVAHINKKHLTQEILIKANQFEKEHNIKLIINFDVDYNNYKFRQIEYYLSNFQKLIESKVEFDYIVFDNFDSLYIKQNSYSHMKKYDIGMNFGKINGYWQDKILSHNTLIEWTKKFLNKDLTELSCKGTAQGVFMKIDIANAIFEMIEKFIYSYKANKDYPQYLAEEVLFQLIALIIEKQKGKKLISQTTLTHLPWERKLQWSKDQIREAKEGFGVSSNKFVINQYIF
ncbi:acetylgalactosaminyl-proteoglycan 3-beta-glucuronosyltransferase [Pasteurellaceae bacterium Orientalotternb1]|nr:acetylgalactosaminyl-proteoglycan 3-beta-glucuronosyltransferase [Pasteurellaceae bacterium Orientalotternb1]